MVLKLPIVDHKVAASFRSEDKRIHEASLLKI